MTEFDMLGGELSAHGGVPCMHGMILPAVELGVEGTGDSGTESFVDPLDIDITGIGDGFNDTEAEETVPDEPIRYVNNDPDEPIPEVSTQARWLGKDLADRLAVRGVPMSAARAARAGAIMTGERIVDPENTMRASKHTAEPESEPDNERPDGVEADDGTEEAVAPSGLVDAIRGKLCEVAADDSTEAVEVPAAAAVIAEGADLEPPADVPPTAGALPEPTDPPEDGDHQEADDVELGVGDVVDKALDEIARAADAEVNRTMDMFGERLDDILEGLDAFEDPVLPYDGHVDMSAGTYSFIIEERDEAEVVVRMVGIDPDAAYSDAPGDAYETLVNNFGSRAYQSLADYAEIPLDDPQLYNAVNNVFGEDNVTLVGGDNKPITESDDPDHPKVVVDLNSEHIIGMYDIDEPYVEINTGELLETPAGTIEVWMIPRETPEGYVWDTARLNGVSPNPDYTSERGPVVDMVQEFGQFAYDSGTSQCQIYVAGPEMLEAVAEVFGRENLLNVDGRP